MAWTWGTLRRWPLAALLLAFIVGATLAGVGGGVLSATLAVLLVGPSYLIQQRLRRRRGLAPTGRGLDVEADAFFHRVAIAELRAMRRHPLLPLLVLVAEIGALAVVWILLGSGWALSVIVVAMVMTGVAFVRRRSVG